MKSIFSLLIVAALTGGANAETDAPVPKMIEIGKAVAESKPAELTRTSADFEKALKEEPLSPSPNIRAEIKAVQDASTRLLANLGEGKFTKYSGEAKAVATAVKSTLDKLDSLIEENYQEQPGVASVSPPASTLNAAAGMNPHAITDPKLRQQYQEAIEKEKTKQEKNAQQRELRTARKLVLMNVAALDSWRSAAGLSKEGLIETFSNEGKSRALLREMVAPVSQR
jgi:hypothetical protein